MKRSTGLWLPALLLFAACAPGYEKEDGRWAWVSYDEAEGKRISPVDSADGETFEILSGGEYARDKDRVYYQGSIIADADPENFLVIGKGYARDDHSVFLDYDKVVLANPETFEVLTFPYSKDDSHVFNGTIPLLIEKQEVAGFRVTESYKLGFGMKSSMTLSYFIESYPEYKWVDTVGVKGVIIGEWATAETRSKKITGLKCVAKLP